MIFITLMGIVTKNTGSISASKPKELHIDKINRFAKEILVKQMYHVYWNVRTKVHIILKKKGVNR